MPAAIVTNQGLLNSLAARLAARLFIRLFRNNVVPAVGSVLGDFEPALFPDYADIELTGSWPDPAFDGAGRAFSRQTVTWIRGTGGVSETEYGWLIYEMPDPDSELVTARRLSIPVVTVSPGNTVTVRVTFYLLRG